MCRQRIEETSSIPQIISEQTEAEGYEDEAYELLNGFIEDQRKKLKLSKDVVNSNSRHAKRKQRKPVKQLQHLSQPLNQCSHSRLQNVP